MGARPSIKSLTLDVGVEDSLLLLCEALAHDFGSCRLLLSLPITDCYEVLSCYLRLCISCVQILIPRSYLLDINDVVIWLPLYMILVRLHPLITWGSMHQVWCDWFSQLLFRLFNLHLLYLNLRLLLILFLSSRSAM